MVVSWQVYAMTHDPLSLGLIGLSEALPFIGVALYAGHVADRSNRQRISVAALFVLVLCAGALLPFSFATERVFALGVWPYYAVIAVSGFARTSLHPTPTPLAPHLVPRDLHH